MNVELLLKVKEAIQAVPEKYDQSAFCGTAYCIAGYAVAIAEPRLWAAAQNKGFDGEQSVWHAAAELLDMPEEEYESLTDPACCWPEPFATKYMLADSDTDRAAAACGVIDYFIARGER